MRSQLSVNFLQQACIDGLMKHFVHNTEDASHNGGIYVEFAENECCSLSDSLIFINNIIVTSS